MNFLSVETFQPFLLIFYMAQQSKQILLKNKNNPNQLQSNLKYLLSILYLLLFLLHILPNRFTKIRHYGLLSNRNRKTIISLCRVLIGTVVNNDFTINARRKVKEFLCPACGSNSFSYKFFYYNSYRLYE